MEAAPHFDESYTSYLNSLRELVILQLINALFVGWYAIT